MSDIFHITERRARKTHRCGEMGCRADILPGQMYTYYHGVSDGSGFSFKACMWCAYVRWFMTGWYLDNGMLDQWDFEDWPALGDLWQWLRDMAGDVGVAQQSQHLAAPRAHLSDAVGRMTRTT